LRKHLAESLVLSKLDYYDCIYYPLPDFLTRRLQRIQFATARFVIGHNVNNMDDIIKVGWLPIVQRQKYYLLKLAHKAINDAYWQSYIELEKVHHSTLLRSSSSQQLVIPLREKTTFQDSAAKLFNLSP